MISPRWAFWPGLSVLVALTILAVWGRASVLTGGQPFGALYHLLPPAIGEDAEALDSHFRAHAGLTWTHILSGTVVLLLAGLQFASRLRPPYVALHRWSGRLLLLVATPAAGSGALLQAKSPYGGALAASAIYFFAAYFLFALARAYLAIRRRDVVGHREWMIRMFAIVLGVGGVRAVALPLVFLTGERPLALVGAAFWLGLGGLALLGELWVRVTRSRQSVLIVGAT
jgi:uncharacterized membrane protein